MSKTPEEMAEEYAELMSFDVRGHQRGFLAGYKAAMEQRIDGNTSDGYHTFNELYEHRHYLFIALMYALQNQGRTWLSSKHADKLSFDGWFIAGINLPTGPITYHLPNRLWIACVGAEAKVLDQAPPWDGHTSTDVLNRLARYSAGICDEVAPPFVGKVMNSSNNSNGWISVEDRLPSCGVLCAWISDTTQSCIERIEVDDMHPWWEGFDYWCELPEPPKEDK